MAQWYVARGKAKQGPFSLSQLQSEVRKGALRVTDMVLQEGAQKWCAASEVPDLFPVPTVAPPPVLHLPTVAPPASPIVATTSPRSLFISYRRGDSPDTVKLIYERLRKRLPRWEIFYDHETIPLGDQFPERLRARVTTATAVLVIIGPKWLNILLERKNAPIDHVREEVRLALGAGNSVVPVLVGRVPLPTEADLAEFADLQPLLKRSGRSVNPDPDFDSDLEPIISHLKQLDAGETVGTILDDKFTLTAEIGVGGMGVVYAAQQKKPVKRNVAIKLIKPGMDSKEILARFDAERQALAVMDHPNIAKVHDAGLSASGRPYFVMEYVKGVPITDYCDEKKLNPQERLNLFIPVCNAVQHAHQKGIIHRDLKPSNVLVEVVDGKPVPKVIDFGLAKATGQQLTDQTQHTTMGMRVGTLEYSAPEQASGRMFDVDTRSDIYSLGVLLYELLTGAPPFTHKELLKVGEEEMRRVIREVEPTTPSKKLSSSGELPAIAAKRGLEPKSLTGIVKNDLDWIVMKCLEKENARRYDSANQLGEELRRFLCDEPVQAGPPSMGYRANKFLRRNKGAVTAASLVFVALVVGIIGTSIGMDQANEATKKALDSASAEKTARDDADRLRRAAEQFSEQARRTLDEAGKDDERTRHVPGAQMLRRELMLSSLRFYEQFAAYYPEDETLRTRLADTHLRLAAATGRVRPIKEALKSFEDGTRILEELIAKEPGSIDRKVKLGEAYFELGQLAFEREQYSDAREILAKAQKLLEPLVRQHPQHDKAVLCLVGANHRLVAAKWILKTRTGHETIDDCTRNVTLLQTILDRHPDHVDALYWQGLYANTLAVMYSGMGQSAAEARHLDEALGHFNKALRVAPDRPDVLLALTNTLRNKAWNLRRQSLSEALATYAEAISNATRLVEKNPDVPRYKQFLADYHRQIANAYLINAKDTDRFAKAAAAFERAAQLYDQLQTQDRSSAVYPRERVGALIALAEMERDRGRRDVARDAFDRAIQTATPAAEAMPTNVDLVYHAARSNLLRGQLDIDDKQPAKGFDYLRSAVTLYQTRLLRLNLPNRSEYLDEYIQVLDAARGAAVAIKQTDEAIRLAEIALPLGSELKSRPHKQRWCMLLNGLAELYSKAAKTDEALATLLKSLATAKPLFDEAPWHWFLRSNLMKTYRQLADIHQVRGDVKEEILMRRRMFTLREPLDGQDYSSYTAAANPLAADEARRLRGVKIPEGMKRFTVPVLLKNGTSFPYHVYITQHVPTQMMDPLADQIRVLEEDDGGTFPKEVRDSFNRLYKIALENKVSFQDLCGYALGTDTSAEEAMQRAKTKEVVERLAADVEELKAAVAKESSNSALGKKLATRCLDLAEAQVKIGEEITAAATRQQARQVLERVLEQAPEDASAALLLAQAYQELGDHRRSTGERDAAYALYRRSIDVLLRLTPKDSSATHRKALAGGYCSLANLLAGSGDAREMVRWLVAAAQTQEPSSLWLLQSSLKHHPKLTGEVPQDLQTAIGKLAKTPRSKTEDQEIDADTRRFTDLLRDEYAVLLLRGKNTKGDQIYVYLKVALPDVGRLQKALKSEAAFAASDFGTVVAAGKGEPSPEVKAEITKKYSDFKHPEPLQIPDAKLASQWVLLILNGANSKGERIYSFLKVTLKDIPRLKEAIQSGKGFNPTNFGTVVASGKGDPTPEIRAEVAKKFPEIEIFDDKTMPAKNLPAPKEIIHPGEPLDVDGGLSLKGELNKEGTSIVYKVKLTASKDYVIDMVSPDGKALDPFLYLLDAAGNKLAEDDDGGGGLNARIRYRPMTTGVYQIRATSYQNVGRGPFTLTVRQQK